MKAMVYCVNNATFEYTSVFIYPDYDPQSLAKERYQIRISHGTVFGNSKQDYAIYKCSSERLRDRIHATLNKRYRSLVANSKDLSKIGCIKMESVIEEAERL